jgi:hypothetical protein
MAVIQWICLYNITCRSQDSSASKVTGYELDDGNSIFDMGRNFLFTATSRPARKPIHYVILWLSET